MTTLRDLPPRTRCMVDVAAMERDGPGPSRCRCPEAERAATWRQSLRSLAEQPVVVLDGATLIGENCSTPRVVERDEVVVSCNMGFYWPAGLLLRRKYLLPLPEQGGETDGR